MIAPFLPRDLETSGETDLRRACVQSAGWLTRRLVTSDLDETTVTLPRAAVSDLIATLTRAFEALP